MRRKTVGTLRGIAVLLMALAGVMAFGTGQVAAQNYLCSTENAGVLALADDNEDGVVDVSELQALADSLPDGDTKTQLQNAIQQLQDGGYDGIQYENCTPGTETPTSTATATATATGTATATETGTATSTATATATATEPSDGGDDNGDDGEVGELPDTGEGTTSDQGANIALALGGISVLMLAGAFALQRRRAA